MSSFSTLLRRRRQAAGLTQADLAQRVRVKQQTVARWEHDKSTPTRDMLARIARAFGEPADDWVRVAGRDTSVEFARLPLPVRPRMDRLPLGELQPSEFERFTAYLLGACYPNATIDRAGGQGHAQGGADILVRTSGEMHLFQCKRLRRFGPTQMEAAANAAATTHASTRVLVLSRVASPSARSAATRVGWEIWDHDDIVRKLQQELSLESARRVVEVFFPGWTDDFLGIPRGGPWVLPEEYFAGQLEESAFSHSFELVGREDELERVLDWARGDRPFFVLAGAAGVGKSRLLMEAARRIHDVSDDTVVYFAEKTAPVDLDDFRGLADDPTFIIVDDAHDRDDLELIVRGARSRSEPQRRPRVLFATRGYGQPRLLRALAEHAHELNPLTVHLAPLTVPSARQLASRVLRTPENSHATIRLAAVTRDCTLFLVAAGYLLKTAHVDPGFLDDVEGFRVAVLDRMYHEHVRGAGDLPGGVRASDALQFLAAVHPFDVDDEDAVEAASQVLGYPRDVLTSALGEIVKTGIVVKRGSRLRLQPDLLADHILVSACFDRVLGKATGYSGRLWTACGAGLRRNFFVNIARIDWRLSESGTTPESMLTEAWRVLEQEFEAGGISQRLDLLDLLEEVAFYQPERTLKLVAWALDHELPAENTPLLEYTYEDVRVKAAPVLKSCAYRREWLYRACDLLWRLAQSDPRPTNPHPDHPARILCDLAAYSRYKPFDYTHQVTTQAIEWLNRDSAKVAFDILDHALRKEFEDHISDGHAVTFYASSVLELGQKRVLALRDEVLDEVIQQLLGEDVSLSVRAAKSLGLALTAPMGIFGRKPQAEEMATWDQESVKLLKRIHTKLDGARLSPPVAVALREAFEPAIRDETEAITAAAEEVLSAVADDLDHQVVEVLMHGPWRWNRPHGPNPERSPDEALQWLKDLARRFLEDSGETSTAVQRVEQHLGEIKGASAASGAGNFVSALVHQRLCIGTKIVQRVIDDADSSLVQVTGVTLSAVRAADAERALELAQTLVNTGVPTARTCVAYAYGSGIAAAPAVSGPELSLIRKLAADDNVDLAHQLSFGLRFLAEKDQRMALMVICDMRIGRRKELAGEVLSLFSDAGPLDLDTLSKDELDGIVDELVACNQIDDYWVQDFVALLSRTDLQRTVGLLQRRVEHAEKHDDLDDYRPVPYRWHDKWRLESQGAPDRRRILEELRDWAAKDAPGWRRYYEAPRIFAAVADQFDDEALDVIGLGLKAPPAIAGNVANLLSAAPRDFAWSRVRWIVRTLEDAARRDTELYRAIGSALQSVLISGTRTGSPGEPFPEDIKQRDEACKVADDLPKGSPGERFYRSVQRFAEHAIQRERNEDWA